MRKLKNPEITFIVVQMCLMYVSTLISMEKCPRQIILKESPNRHHDTAFYLGDSSRSLYAHGGYLGNDIYAKYVYSKPVPNNEPVIIFAISEFLPNGAKIDEIVLPVSKISLNSNKNKTEEPVIFVPDENAYPYINCCMTNFEKRYPMVLGFEPEEDLKKLADQDIIKIYNNDELEHGPKRWMSMEMFSDILASKMVKRLEHLKQK